MTGSLVHSVGAMFVDDLDLYCWVESMPSAEDLYETIQAETKMWGDLLLATGGSLSHDKYVQDSNRRQAAGQEAALFTFDVLSTMSSSR